MSTTVWAYSWWFCDDSDGPVLFASRAEALTYVGKMRNDYERTDYDDGSVFWVGEPQYVYSVEPLTVFATADEARKDRGES